MISTEHCHTFMPSYKKKNEDDNEPDCLKVMHAGITGEVSKIKILSKVHHTR